jgi:hypothetical protein
MHTMSLSPGVSAPGFLFSGNKKGQRVRRIAACPLPKF